MALIWSYLIILVTQKKKDGVCVYYKEHIPLNKCNDLCTLVNWLVTEIQWQSKKYFLTCAYCSPSQELAYINLQM